MPAREQRRLAAIVAVDLVGYSRLMGRDEAGTVARLRQVRAERLEPVLARRGGRVVKLTGDGALMEFASAVEALSAAIEFQQAMIDGEAERPEPERLVFRVGVHLGDVIVDGDDLYGDGVNVAARLEAAAPAGGIVVSGDMHSVAVGRLSATFEGLDGLTLKNIERSVQAYAVHWKPSDWLPPMPTGSAAPPSTSPLDSPLALPDKPSIAVLPFQNMSGDPDQEYFADGIVEDIITALSRFKSLFVIGRNSSFTYKDRAVDINQVGRELGVRYVLEGSVRKAGNRLRITGQLIEAATLVHLWADRFDGPLEDVFALQDRVTFDVVGAIASKLEQADIERVTRKPTEHMGAYDFYLRGVAAYHSGEEEGLKKAQVFCSQAITLDPRFAAPYAVASFCQVLQHGIGIKPSDRELTVATQRSRQAVEIDRDDAMILSMATWVEAHFTRDLDAAADLAERAVAINPNLAFAWAASGWVHIWMGNSAVGLKHLLQARRLNPLDINQRFVLTGIAHAHFMLEQYEDAFAVGVRALQNWRQAPAYRVGAASAALSGRLIEARKLIAGLLEVDPGRRLGNLEETLGAYRRVEDLMHLKRGLKLAGLPE